MSSVMQRRWILGLSVALRSGSEEYPGQWLFRHNADRSPVQITALLPLIGWKEYSGGKRQKSSERGKDEEQVQAAGDKSWSLQELPRCCCVL